MLRNTFVHLPGVGPKRERAFWEQGILDWDGFLAHPRRAGSRAASATRWWSWCSSRSRRSPGATPASSSRTCRRARLGGSTPSSPTGPCSSTSRRRGSPANTTT